jgi:AmiR/NasT family two-component response regulator
MGSVTVPDPPCGTAACEELLISLATAIERRDVIGTAKGIVMVRSSCGPDDAFDVLRRASMRENIKVYDIAARIVRVASPVADRAELALTN